MGCHFFQTQGLNPGLWCPLHWQADSLPLRHLGSPEKDSRISKQDISKAIIDSWFQPQNVNFWKLSLYSLTITNNLGKLKFSYFPWAHRELRFQGKPPPWIWRDKWRQILKVKISLPEQKLPEPESGRNGRIIMLINGWGCVPTNRRVGLPWGLLSGEQRTDILWFYHQQPYQVVKCQEKNHFMSQQIDKESN